MFRFKKEKPQPPPQCDHKWQDFPWIIHGLYDPVCHCVRVTITEPYVCIHCGERKDVTLYNKTKIATSQDKADDIYMKVYETYKDHIEDKAVVEDMIADMQLVDREYLKYYNIVHGGADALERIKKGGNAQ